MIAAEDRRRKVRYGRADVRLLEDESARQLNAMPGYFRRVAVIAGNGGFPEIA